MGIIFSSPCVLGKRIRLSETRWTLICTRKHPELAGRQVLVARPIHDAVFVRRSRYDSSIYLYYLAYNEYWLCVVCRIENGTGYVVTAYLTDRMKKWDDLWTR